MNSLAAETSTVRLRAEQVLANARLLLAIGGLLAVWLDPAEPAVNAARVYLLFGGYLVLALAIALYLRRNVEISEYIPLCLYAVDFAFAASLTLLTSGLSSPLFVFFWFFLLAGAFRYGFVGAAGAGALLMAAIAIQWFWGPTADLNFMIARVSYVAVLAFVAGYFAQRERDLRLEAVIVARTLARARDARSWALGLQRAVDELVREFAISQAILAVRFADGERSAWSWARKPGGVDTHHTIASHELEALFPTVPTDLHVWHCGRGDPELRGIDFDGNRVRMRAPEWPALWQQLGAHTMCGIVAPLSDGGIAHVYLPDPAAAETTWSRLRLLHTVALYLVPAIHNLLLLQREASIAERARLAHELHDHVIQSLIGLQMQVAVLLRTASPEALRDHATSFSTVLQEEIANLRDLMEDLRPVNVEPAELPFYLQTLAQRFEHATGIRTSLQVHASTMRLTQQQCTTLVRLIQEALVNVRKHSGATTVSLTLRETAAGLALSIADDGRGFDFVGRLGHERLATEHRGPKVIKERARAMGALLAIESHPDRGARLDVFIPHAA